MRCRLLVLAVAATLLPATAALAQSPPPTATTPVIPPATTTTDTTPAPAPEPAPVAPTPVSGTIKLTLDKVHGSRAAILEGQRFRVKGTVKPYVSHQSVTVRFYVGRHKLASKKVHVVAVGGGVGHFLLGYSPKTTGRVTVRATHLATAEMKTIKANTKSLTVMPTHFGFGAKGKAVAALQRMLEGMHLAVKPTGSYDDRTGRAVLAFQKLNNLARSSVADKRTLELLLSGAGAFKVRFPKQGRHVEANLAKQVIALIGPKGRVEHVYPVSSGKPSTPTILGTYQFYSKTPGYNSEGMYFSSYFIRGYAIHGFDPSPDYAASHGCLRTWIPDAIAIYNWVRLGETIDVYPG